MESEIFYTFGCNAGEVLIEILRKNNNEYLLKKFSRYYSRHCKIINELTEMEDKETVDFLFQLLYSKAKSDMQIMFSYDKEKNEYIDGYTFALNCIKAHKNKIMNENNENRKN